ncbi:MAG: metallopeptidase family protein [Alphaproteobacteria bacterium]|nr:metallopeptidase family protein [Alphaproteobacteria bacterium]
MTGSTRTPPIDEFEAIADQVFDDLPDLFRERCADVVIRIEDFPADDDLTGLGLNSPYDLLGLYHGVSLPERSVTDSGTLPDMVHLYRQPILLYCRSTGEALEAVIAHVLIHELGHHFGFSDEDMEAIEAEAG